MYLGTYFPGHGNAWVKGTPRLGREEKKVENTRLHRKYEYKTAMKL